MKLHLHIVQGKVTVLAVIPKSKKLNLPRRQKSWKLLTVAPNFSAEEMKKSYTQEAERWAEKTIAKIRDKQNGVKAEELKQESLI